jgi:serine/threonine protein kinase
VWSQTPIAERYYLGDKLGEGGQATVYRAWDSFDQREVALKMLGTTGDPTIVGRVAREQRAMVALAGTNAVEFIDLCAGPSGTLCLVMELLEGRDLEAHLSDLEHAGDPMPLTEIVAIMAPLVETLDKAHSVGIVHRDLKPGNIFLLSDSVGGGSRLLDFGMANLSSADPLTTVGTVMGSPSYIAPEGWSGKPRGSDGRGDVYALGVILFRMLSGRLPFQSKTLIDKMRNTTTAERPSLRALRPGLPPHVDIWVERALAIDPNERFPTAGASFGELLWALGLAPHPSQQRRVRLAEATVVGMRAFLEHEGEFEDDELIEELTALSMEPMPLDDDDLQEEGTVLDSLPLLESLAPPDAAAGDRAHAHPHGRAPVGPLPPIPQLPPLPANQTARASPPEALAQEPSAVRTVASPPSQHGSPEVSGNDLDEGSEDRTTFYAHPDLWIDSGKR